MNAENPGRTRRQLPEMQNSSNKKAAHIRAQIIALRKWIFFFMVNRPLLIPSPVNMFCLIPISRIIREVGTIHLLPAANVIILTCTVQSHFRCKTTRTTEEN